MPRCNSCFGYGMWPRRPWPQMHFERSRKMGPLDFHNGNYTAPCPECGANPRPVSVDSGLGSDVLFVLAPLTVSEGQLDSILLTPLTVSEEQLDSVLQYSAPLLAPTETPAPQIAIGEPDCSCRRDRQDEYICIDVYVSVIGTLNRITGAHEWNIDGVEYGDVECTECGACIPTGPLPRVILA
mgnify:CR=1 FL=1